METGQRAAEGGDRERVSCAVKRFAACLRVIGPTLDPDRMTEIMRCQPDIAYRNGDAFRTGHRRTGAWMITSRSDDGLDSMINGLLDRLPEDDETWLGLILHFKIDVFCAVFEQPGFSLDWRTLHRLGQRHIEFGLDTI